MAMRENYVSYSSVAVEMRFVNNTVVSAPPLCDTNKIRRNEI